MPPLRVRINCKEMKDVNGQTTALLGLEKFYYALQFHGRCSDRGGGTTCADVM